MYNKELMLEFSIKHAKYYWRLALKKFPELKHYGDMPEFKMNARLTAIGGRAWLDSNFIDLSCYLLERNWETYKKEVIPHELCHFIAYRLFDDKGHGLNWKYVMEEMGLEPNRCHSMITKYQAEKGN